MAKSSATKNRRPPIVSKPAEPDMDTGTIDLEVTAPRPTGAKNQTARAIRETEVLDSVSGLSLDAVSSTLASTQVEVQKSLADLSAKLVEHSSSSRTSKRPSNSSRKS